MKKITSTLIIFLTLSTLSCDSDIKSIKSNYRSKKDAANNKLSQEKKSDSDTNKTALNFKLRKNNSSVHPHDDMIFSTPEIQSNKDTTSSKHVQVIQEIDSYNFHNYDQLNTLLKKYVSASGNVNYSEIKADHNALNTILKEFEDNYPEKNWSNNEKLAYWINAYNIFTIKLIVDNYPTTSITKITTEPWKKKFINLRGTTISLNHIENEIIRKEFNEPRIHFALNCASKSCPVLLNTAYTSDNLQSKLTSQTKRFLNDTSKNKFDNKNIYISKIFDWYKEDFTQNGTVIDFINKYRTEQLSSPKINFTEYSWDLNE